MPEKRTIERARKDRRQGKSPSTQAGEFVREEIDKIRHGAHGARSPEQAIAIGLSMARRAGVPLRPPAKGKTKERTRRSAEYAYAAGQKKRRTRRRPRVARAVEKALKREPRSTVSRGALSRHAKRAAARRSAGALASTAARVLGTANAAASPCKARPANSAAGEPASAMMHDATANSANPAIEVNRAPKRSAAWPPITITAAETTR